MTFLTHIFIILGIVYLIIGMLGFGKNPKNKTNTIFLLICIDLMLWAFISSLLISAPTRQLAAHYRKDSAVSWSFLYCLVLHFSLLISSMSNYINKKWKIFLLYLPGIVSLLIYTISGTPLENFVMTDYGWSYIDKNNTGLIYFWYFDVYCIIYVIAIIYCICRWGKSTKSKREKKQAQIISMSIFITAIFGIITDIILPKMKLSSVPLLCVIFIIVPIYAIYYAIKKYQFMSLTPQNLALEYISIMNEGLIILDENNTIQDINRGASNLLLYNEEELKGSDVSKITPLNSKELSDINKQCGIEYNLRNKNNISIPVILSYSVLFDKFGEKYGTVIIFQDISEIEKTHLELQAKVFELQQTNITLNKEIRMREVAEKKVSQLAYYDQLTRLPNRRLLFKRLREAENSVKVFTILYLDLDLFKNINDSMGHQAGDELLKKVAERLVPLLNSQETVARIGGDEFFILLKDVSDVSHAVKIAEKIIEIFRSPFKVKGKNVSVTTSIGIAAFPDDGKNIMELIRSADVSLYQAKRIGKNRYFYFKKQK